MKCKQHTLLLCPVKELAIPHYWIWGDEIFVETGSGMRMQWLSKNEQGSSIFRVVSLSDTLSPCSNLGYLAVISLAHCNTRCCCWVGTLCSFSLPLFLLPFMQTSCRCNNWEGTFLSCLEDRSVAMADGGKMVPIKVSPTADVYPKRIMEYIEGFLISKVTYVHRICIQVKCRHVLDWKLDISVVH